MKYLICSLLKLSFNNTFAANDYYHNEPLEVTAKGIAFACQGFAHPSCGRTGSENLEDTNRRAISKCQGKGYNSAILINQYQCDTEETPPYSITTTCYGGYRCE